MKNPYLRLTLVISLFISILFTVALVVGQWANAISISQYGSIIDTTTSDTGYSTWTFTEKPNTYGSISKVADYIQRGAFLPLYPLFYITNPFLFSYVLEVAGPVIIFLVWFIIFYVVTFLYSKFVRKNLVKESGNYRLLIIVCVAATVFMSIGHTVYLYIQSASLTPKDIILDSVSPTKASDGDYITLTGSGFSKQDITVWLVGKEEQDEIYGFLWSGQPGDDKILNIPLKTKGLCNNALQNPCQNALANFGSGNYTIEIRGGGNIPSIPFEIMDTMNGITFTEAPSKLQRTKGTINKETYTIPINYLPMDALVSMTGQLGIKIDDIVKEGTFYLPDQVGREETLSLVSFNQYLTTEEARTIIEELGYQPADIAEFISFVWNINKTWDSVVISTAIVSEIPIKGVLMTPVYRWIDGAPNIYLRNSSEYQEKNEFSLVKTKTQ